ncbi:MAG: cysteine--tRNA ligase, partial [Limisphaerales bacterium]
VQEFAPLNPPKAGMYCCGPTVYDFAHIGNWRTFVFADLVRRFLEFKNFQVTHVMNITDVEDKIIKGVNSASPKSKVQSPKPDASTLQRLREFTGKYETAFFDDLKTLNCKMPHQTPRATEHIPEIISLIEKLLARGIAYKAADGSVYFSIEKYRGCGCNYGQLLKLNFDEMRAGERVKSDEYAKESVADFALWKSRTPDDGEIFWPSPFGEGRPGWHIECSAMSMKILGASFDLHLGGEDLIFPHHEDEIAQSEGATQKPFVKHWLHGAHLLVEGKKMSKSLGNFFTLRDLLAKGFSGREIRYLLLSAHYRETFNFTLDGLTGAKSALARIDECVGKLRTIVAQASSLRDRQDACPTNDSTIQRFNDALDDDLNISAAWGEAFKWVTATNKCLAENSLNLGEVASALATWKKMDSVLGLGETTSSSITFTENTENIGVQAAPSVPFWGKRIGEFVVPSEIMELLEARQAARKTKDFKKSDAIRDELKSKGWTIEDTPKGPKLKKT